MDFIYHRIIPPCLLQGERVYARNISPCFQLQHAMERPQAHKTAWSINISMGFLYKEIGNVRITPPKSSMCDMVRGIHNISQSHSSTACYVLTAAARHKLTILQITLLTINGKQKRWKIFLKLGHKPKSLLQWQKGVRTMGMHIQVHPFETKQVKWNHEIHETL